jgi:hemolysin activation/secretion protein
MLGTGIAGWFLVTGALFPANPWRQIGDPLRARQQKERARSLEALGEGPAPGIGRLDASPQTGEANATGGPCIRIERIEAPGITRIPSAELRELLRPWEARCDTLEDLTRLIRRINARYVAKGYITSLAYLEPQDLSGGTLRISVMEGRIERIEGEGAPTAFLFPGLEGEVLNLRDLEAGITRLNRLRSLHTEMEILPGKSTGTSRVVVRGTRVHAPVFGTIGLNNYGSRATGRFQLEGELVWENPLQLADRLSLRFGGTGKQGPSERSRDFALAWSLPAGRNLLSLEFAGFAYRQRIDGIAKSYLSEGTSRTVTVRWERELYRSRHSDGSAALSLIRRRDTNKFAGVRLDLSSHRLTILRLAYTHRFDAARWRGGVTAALYRGTKLWGASRAAGLSPRFTKATLDFDAAYAFEGWGDRLWRWDLALHAQWGERTLPGVEQIGVGGPYSVRGFSSDEALSGNSGFYLRSELSTSLRYGEALLFPYLALDGGAVARNRVSTGGALAGAVLGLRGARRGWEGELFAAAPLHDSRPDRPAGIGHGRVGMTLRYHF